MRRYVLLLAALSLFGQSLARMDDQSDPVSDRLRFEIAVAQRDYLDAQLHLDRAEKQLLLKTAEAQRLCTKQEKVWQADSFTCRATEKK